MPVAKKPNLEDLLEPDAPTVDSIVPEAEEAPVTAAEPSLETPAQRRIRELQAELDRAEIAPTQPDGRPVPESQLTPEQKQIRDLEDRLARKNADRPMPVQYASPTGNGESILIHFLEDGFVFGGAVWYRGQEVEFEVGGLAYEQTKDRAGNSWLDLRDDIDGQFDRWGKQFFAAGPWRGRKWSDSTAVSDPDEAAALAAAAQAEQRRNRAAPILPSF